MVREKDQEYRETMRLGIVLSFWKDEETGTRFVNCKELVSSELFDDFSFCCDEIEALT